MSAPVSRLKWMLVTLGEMLSSIISSFSSWEASVWILMGSLIVTTSSVLLGHDNMLSNRRLYTIGESHSEVLGYQSRHYNTNDFYLKYNTRTQVSTCPYLLQATQQVCETKKRVYSLPSRRINNSGPTAEAPSYAMKFNVHL